MSGGDCAYGWTNLNFLCDTKTRTTMRVLTTLCTLVRNVVVILCLILSSKLHVPLDMFMKSSLQGSIGFVYSTGLSIC